MTPGHMITQADIRLVGYKYGPGVGSTMNIRRFNILCITLLVSAGAIAIAVVQSAPQGGHVDMPTLSDIVSVPSLSLPLSLSILFNVGLAVIVLIWVFGDRSEETG